MNEFFSVSWWTALSSILLIDLTMSGDNAILIALVCKNISSQYRYKAMILGCAGAVLTRIVFTAFALKILSIAYIQFLGGIVLLYVAGNLLTNSDEQSNKKMPVTLFSAVKTIIIADLIMSIDNILSMAGVASTVPGNKWSLVICGVLISLPIIVCGAKFFLVILKKFPLVIYAGGAVLAFTAAKMVASDKAMGIYLADFTGYIEIIFVMGIILYGILKKTKF
ncbi:YjbE family putative metal transport protein [Pectinatus sottacetonis]|uniref:YjbE family putative metal transport protein n=1 Tax=Pectinatus sottacetonis TaxID=1002795 RepID=UPI0018C4B890|nr:YjbE family putative metal transport protein [Pectinatus sottacetonis]